MSGMRTLLVASACAALLTSDNKLAANAFIVPFNYRTSDSTVARKAVSDDMTTAINKVMRSTPIPHIPQQSVIDHTSLLVSLWDKIAFPNENDEDTDFRISDYGLSRKDVGGFITHFQTCKDCAADHAFLMATQDDSGADVLRLSNVYFPMLSEDDSDDDWGKFNPDMMGDEIDENTRSIFPVELDDDIVLADTKEWVQRVIADFGVCPFTIDKNRAGIPMGGVRYSVSRAVQPELAFLRYWEEVEGLLKVPEKEMSTILLVFPELALFGDYELFESYCESLADALCGSTMGMESEIQLVFFHPRYQFRDGQARTGEEMGAANFARRSPWPMINILRTPQVRAAQKGIPTGQVYKQNEERLSAVGTSTLETMLYDRDWNGLPAHAQHSKGVRAQELSTGAPLSISAAEVIAQRVSVVTPVPVTATVAPGVCPFPHGMTVDASVVSASHDDIVASVSVQAPVPVRAVAAPVKTQETQATAEYELVEIFENMNDVDGVSGGVDYMALADEVERWLAEEESLRDQ